MILGTRFGIKSRKIYQYVSTISQNLNRWVLSGLRSKSVPAENTACQPSRPNLPMLDNANEYLTCTPVRYVHN